jgi:type VI secretion system secreted protein VgrG
VNLDDVLAQNVTVVMETANGTKRYFQGIVASFMQDGMVGDLSRYRALVRPWLWLLTRSANCRIFQQQSVPEIVEAIFREKGFTDFKKALSRTYEPREFCVQYRETDFVFISRLLEAEGIYYYFQHDETKHTLVLADGASSHRPLPGYAEIPYYPQGNVRREKGYIHDWSISREVQPGKVTLDAYDFTKPNAELQSVSAVDRSHAQSKCEYFDYPGKYLQTSQGETYARLRLEAFQAQHEQTVGHCNVEVMAPGGLFKLTGCPRQDRNAEYLVTAARYELKGGDYQSGGGGEGPYRCRFVAIPSVQPYRPAPITPKPVIQGPQTAVVVGKKGEEIWTDQYGRIKVQFHWDRQGKADENSSCWIRVAQVWAGKKWGGLDIPRLGQEVVVEFLEGDPDQPIVTGSVYNADHMPPFNLPDQATQSGLRTRSTKQGDEKTFNELRFEDKKGSEQIYFHAERDFARVVENDDSLKVGFEKHDPGNCTVDIYNNYVLTVEKGSRLVEIKELDDSLKVTQGNQDIQIAKGNQTTSIDQGNQTTTIAKGNQSTTISQGKHELTISQGGSTIGAAQSIELKVGSSSIKIEPAKITLTATQIELAANAKIAAKSPMVQVNADGNLILKGGLVQIN